MLRNILMRPNEYPECSSTPRNHAILCEKIAGCNREYPIRIHDECRSDWCDCGCEKNSNVSSTTS